MYSYSNVHKIIIQIIAYRIIRYNTIYILLISYLRKRQKTMSKVKNNASNSTKKLSLMIICAIIICKLLSDRLLYDTLLNKALLFDWRLYDTMSNIFNLKVEKMSSKIFVKKTVNLPKNCGVLCVPAPYIRNSFVKSQVKIDLVK